MKEGCTIYETSNFIGKRWTLLILLELYKTQGTKRYTALKKSLPGITPKILSEQLKELSKENLINKKIDASTLPVKCYYSLTESGEDFIHVIKRMKKWALKWKIDNALCNPSNCRHCKF